MDKQRCGRLDVRKMSEFKFSLRKTEHNHQRRRKKRKRAKAFAFRSNGASQPSDSSAQDPQPPPHHCGGSNRINTATATQSNGWAEEATSRRGKMVGLARPAVEHGINQVAFYNFGIGSCAWSSSLACSAPHTPHSLTVVSAAIFSADCILNVVENPHIAMEALAGTIRLMPRKK